MTPETIPQAMAALAKVDADIARALPQVGAPAARARERGFATFFSTIVSQQLSVEAARSIMNRVNTLLPALHAQAVMDVEGEVLRDAGLSWRKVEYARGLAEAELAGTFSADGLEQLSDEEVISAITALRGFGRWSAEIYLMFSLGRTDVFPADDLALRVALGRLKRMDDKPTPKQARQMVEHWAPWRSVGALFLWHYYRGEPL
ncbi:DNA-3-methyladenine glycosylase family protein [Halomonas sp. GD1P12]|uniref:DNA-3-methyladenine glycosylase family protein n=1 Tax=Halomonas sp. GD1P12 TaxID=2982691 RepID=UPI0021E3CD7E|nr:DNA-3-methyladenine glycosylase 2 family protein [Halomonas sp. GD1P12]UYF99912.1 DNA-3-methyladenine glycosylase 2 family protein [Halomonas sp. GD1P12]